MCIFVVVYYLRAWSLDLLAQYTIHGVEHMHALKFEKEEGTLGVTLRPWTLSERSHEVMRVP